MGKGGYLGGSTIIRAFPKLSRRQPKKGAIESWVKDARENHLELPEDMQAALLAAKVEEDKRGNKAKRTKNKRVKAFSPRAKKGQMARKKTVAKRLPNEPLPEFAALVDALREKYSK